jgi:subtilisin family serine protease
MREKYVILRSSVRPSRRDSSVGPRPELVAAEPVRFSVEVDEIEMRSVPALRRKSDVRVVAPGMPMKLIKPIQSAVPAPPASDGITWGIKAVGANTSPFSGDGIVVAVLDTGIEATHAAFTGVDVLEKDFTGEGNGDRNGHGTHCAGTLFGRNIENTRIGVAPGVKKALIGKVLDGEGGSSLQIANAIQWAAENGANIISMSLGMDFPGFVARLQEAGLRPEAATTHALEGYRANVQLFEHLSAFIRTRESFTGPTVIVAAAGNESERPDFEIAVSPPAVSEGIVSVAALQWGDAGLTIAPFSNAGAKISGPGVGIVSANLGGALTSMNGTSMATPHVAGVAVLWAEKLKASRALTAVNLASRLIGTASTESLGSDFEPFDVGAGLVRAPQE